MNSGWHVNLEGNEPHHLQKSNPILFVVLFWSFTAATVEINVPTCWWYQPCQHISVLSLGLLESHEVNMVVMWSALTPHNKKVMGHWGLSVWSWIFICSDSYPKWQVVLGSVFAFAFTLHQKLIQIPICWRRCKNYCDASLECTPASSYAHMRSCWFADWHFWPLIKEQSNR